MRSGRHFASNRPMMTAPTLDQPRINPYGGLGSFNQPVIPNEYRVVVGLVQNLPPDTSDEQVARLFAQWPSLKVLRVENLAPGTTEHKERPSRSKKVHFPKDADPNEFDSAVKDLNNKKYLGKGYYVHVERFFGDESHIKEKQPFNAQPYEKPKSHVAPPSSLTGSASNYTKSQYENSVEQEQFLLVTAHPPPDLATRKLIHQTVDAVVKGGVEFEATLMQNPQVQQNERFAWLYDQSHPLSRYYRWCLFTALASEVESHQFDQDTKCQELFYKEAQWKVPRITSEDEFAVSLDHLKENAEAIFEEDDDIMNPKTRHAHGLVADKYQGMPATSYGILEPRLRTFLIYLLVDLPATRDPLNHQVASISAFAFNYADKGMDEIVELLVTNVIQPFHLTPANRDPPKDALTNEHEYRRRHLANLTVNALKVLNDVLLTSVNPQVTGIFYKYRALISDELTDRKVFDYLQLLPAQLEMGLMNTDWFYKEVNKMLELWKDQRICSDEQLDHMTATFNGPINAMKQRDEVEKRQREKEERVKQAAVQAAAQAAVRAERERSPPFQVFKDCY